MGYLLKEALKTLCGVNEWAYAVFWKIGCQNPELLIWEECYYEPLTYPSLPGISGTYNPGLGSQDWSSAEANNSHLGVQAGNRIHFLVNRMMMDNQVNVLGEGLVGRAAFTGHHQWIMSENYKREAHPPEVLKEVFQQFSAGMRTIAAIPVLPHGVVQLGSCMAIMENVAFVNDVKALVLQLGCVPGVFLSQNFATKEPAPKVGVPVCLGNSAGRSMVVYPSSFIADSYDYKSNLTQSAIYVGQTSSSVGQAPDIGHSTAAILQASNMSPTLVTPHADQCQVKVGLSANTHLSNTGQLTNGMVKAEVIPSNPDVWLNQQTSSNIPRSTFDLQASICSSAMSAGSLTQMEQEISADTGVQNHISNSNLSDRLMISILKTNAGLVSSSCQDILPIPPTNVKEFYGAPKRNLESFSNLDSLSDANLLSGRNKPGTHHVGSEFQGANSSKSVVSLSNVFDNSISHKLLTGSSVSGYHTEDNISQIDLADMNDRLENDLYQPLSGAVSECNPSRSLSECISRVIHKEERQEYGLQIPSLRDAMYGGACAQPHSGDDLFDILGVDFKNKLLSCSWNNSQNSGSDSNITSLDKNNSALVKGSDSAAGSFPVNQGHFDSSLFSVTGTDHLLDAVISSIQPSAKHSLDDNVSCRTTLTNASSSSVPNALQSSCQVGMSGKTQGELFGFPKSLGKPGALGSYSFKSGPCEDNAGSYSQSSSVYGSPISSWIEQGHDVKPTSSVSTAHSKKPDDASKTNRKRLKPGENPRPRPKDRQMIQDRVKELREIVPNGAKCSIDALLERTIKHMLFLQSVAKHADKLKQSGESKILGKESGLLIKDNHEGGATWAYEVGSQSMVCPIIVEDLNQPRQMLVEMLCEERGLFLEIADIIRGLGLSILKGVMETRNDKIWARFAVEANRDVPRMEIFMSLVRLLDQTVKNGVAPINSIENDNMIVHQLTQAASSIPVSGRSCGLQ